MKKEEVLKKITDIEHTFITTELDSRTYTSRMLVDQFLLVCITGIELFVSNPSLTNWERLTRIIPALGIGIDSFKNMAFSWNAERREIKAEEARERPHAKYPTWTAKKRI